MSRRKEQGPWPGVELLRGARIRYTVEVSLGATDTFDGIFLEWVSIRYEPKTLLWYAKIINKNGRLERVSERHVALHDPQASIKPPG